MGFVNRLAGFFRRNRLEQDLDEELQFHIELKTQENIAAGMPPEEARYAALRAFGGVEQKKEECRDADRLRWIEDVIQDVRYGLRQLRRNPGFTAVAILTLALGIGATTAIFSVVDGVLLKPLPYPHADRLVSVSCPAPSIKLMHHVMSAAMYFVYRDDSRTLHDLSLYKYSYVTVTGRAEPEVLLALDATHELLPTLGARRRHLYFSVSEQEGHKEDTKKISWLCERALVYRLQKKTNRDDEGSKAFAVSSQTPLWEPFLNFKMLSCPEEVNANAP